MPTGWTAYNGYGNDACKGVALASDQAHSGTMSLKSSSMTPGEERIQKSLAALGATANKHWGRIFYKVQSPAPKTSGGIYFHTTMVALEATDENRVVDSVQSPDGTHQWIYNVPDDSCCTGSTYDWTFDANWHCAEWYVDVTAKSYRFFTDSTEVTSLAFTNNANAKMSSYTAIVVGSIFYQTPPSAVRPVARRSGDRRHPDRLQVRSRRVASVEVKRRRRGCRPGSRPSGRSRRASR